MSLESFLLKQKKAVWQEWFDFLVATYPPETTRMLKKESNQFANPVGHTFHSAIGEVLDQFLGENDPGKLAPLLDKIIRIRAVQDFPPSRALAFIYFLKRIAREMLSTELEEGRIPWKEVLEFEAKVDELALLAFDVYVRCRENLFDIKVNEIKNRTQRLLHLAEIIGDLPPEEPEDK